MKFLGSNVFAIRKLRYKRIKYKCIYLLLCLTKKKIKTKYFFK